MTDSPHLRYQVNFESSAMDPERFYVHSMKGSEEISRLYSFEVVVSPRDQVPLVLEDVEEIFGGTATISFGPEMEHPVQGVIRRIDTLPTDDPKQVAYQMTLVPRLWDSQLTCGSWIYQEKTVQEILETALGEILPEDSRMSPGPGLEFTFDGSYNPREYVVQYEESVFDFVSRQAEHWGIYYFFEHSEEEEKLIFADSNGTFPELPDHEQIPFDGRVDITDFSEHVFSIRSTQKVVPGQISLRDYNYRTPSLALVTPMVAVDGEGVGDVYRMGDHFSTPAEGAGLAVLRSEQLYSHKLRMEAKSRVRGLRAGHRFRLVGGTPEFLGLARDYLVVGVEHRFSRADGEDAVPSYENTLRLLPYEVAFRPERITRKPRIHGFMTAKVDSESADDGINCPVDEWGRYKVVMPFDVAGETGGRSSCWIRLATPASGGSWGLAQQIHIGQEVAIFHLDGDPDRPVIAGALPNFENPSVITSQNPNVSQMKSRGGSGFRIRDA